VDFESAFHQIVKVVWDERVLRSSGSLSVKVVPGAGLEPAQYFYRWILNPLRLPIPPSGHF
jgi:hypothetical protein